MFIRIFALINLPLWWIFAIIYVAIPHILNFWWDYKQELKSNYKSIWFAMKTGKLRTIDYD